MDNKKLSSKEQLKKDFIQLLNVNTPIINIVDYDFVRIDNFLAECLKGKTVEEWNPSTFLTNWGNKHPLPQNKQKNLYDFLLANYVVEADDDNIIPEKYIILRECQSLLSDDAFDKKEQVKIVTLLLLMAQRHIYKNDYYNADNQCRYPEYNVTIIFISTKFDIPEALQKYVRDLEVNVPDDNEIKELIKLHVDENNYTAEYEKDKDRINDALLPSLRGLTAFEIDRTIDNAMSTNGTLEVDDKSAIEGYKKELVKQSGVLELISVDKQNDSFDNIGGLDGLWNHLKKVKPIIDPKNSAKVKEMKITIPKGVFLAGMPGCGKSLSAKSASNFLDVPLLKMDIGKLMGKYVGESEANMRKALKVAEAASPCILWIDEIEKAFAKTDDGNGIMQRIFGNFLGWMQDKKAMVYVIATANNINNLPPELKRKGRFDEIFCMLLPNEEARKSIFKVHLKKKGLSESLATDKLARNTEGACGADIECIVNEAVIDVFCNENKDSKVTSELLERKAKEIPMIFETCKENIQSMYEDYEKGAFIDASTGEKINEADLESFLKKKLNNK